MLLGANLDPAGDIEVNAPLLARGHGSDAGRTGSEGQMSGRGRLELTRLKLGAVV